MVNPCFVVDVDKQRDKWVDVLKFLGIFAIYLGHFTEMGGPFYEFVFTYHVPLFFLCGGFFFKPTKTAIDSIKQIVNKFCHIMIPYFIYSLIKIGVESIYYNYCFRNVISQLYEAMLGRRNHVGSLWFLTSFFTTFVLITVLYKIFRSRYLVLVITFILHCLYPYILLFMGIEPLSLIWNLDSDIDYMFYFVLGWCVYPLLIKLDYKKDIQHKIIFYIFFVVSGMVVAIVYFKGMSYIQQIFWPEDSLRLIKTMVTLIIILFNCLCAKLLSGIQCIGEIGKHTLILCGLEDASKTILAALLLLVGVEVNFTNPLTTIFYTAVCIAFCYRFFVKIILKHFPILAGKWSLKL